MVHSNSSGDYAWQEDRYEHIDEEVGEKTKTGAIDDTGEVMVGSGSAL